MRTAGAQEEKSKCNTEDKFPFSPLIIHIIDLQKNLLFHFIKSNGIV